MDGAQVHFEVFARKNGKSGFTLELATEERAKALETAEEMLAAKRAIAVKVTKETMDVASGVFQSVTILSKGEAARPQSKAPLEDAGPLCVSPADLYTGHARERIGRLLDGWLLRQRATPFDLLHRPDLVEKLEASGVEIQHAMQKIAIPEAQAKGTSVHEVIRGFQKLVEQAIERILKHQRQGAFPDFAKESFADAVTRLLGDPDCAYKIGVGVAGDLQIGASWSQKVDRILDLADRAPTEARARAMAFSVLEQPLSEILGARAGMAELLGADLDLGGSLLALTRMAAAEAVDALVAADPRVARQTPSLDGPAARLANWLDSPHFAHVRSALAKRVLQELTSPRRLRPGDPVDEIEVMRALAMVLTAAGGRLLQPDDIRDAFAYRSESLVTSDFVAAYLNQGGSALEEVQALVRLAENVTGATNKRKAAQWLSANVTGLRFEREMRDGDEPAAAKLMALAELQRALCRVGLLGGDDQGLCEKIGEVGAAVEAGAQLIASIGRANTGVSQKLAVLLRMAAGETSPTGPVAARAKAEVLKLFRAPETREALVGAPETLSKLKPLMQAVGLAA